tara:strand:+ start:463 stop:603 length:141 start_codon:yes stop_codon:yes gene_type:complete
MKKTIFITGAAKRIGKEIALCFSEMAGILLFITIHQKMMPKYLPMK